jgi:hypothetical protein
MNLKKLVFILAFLITGHQKMAAQSFYDTAHIASIHIYFPFSDWRTRMDTAKAGEEGYIQADSVVIDGKKYNNPGVKFKGNSTYSKNRLKNPLHIKLDYLKNNDHQGYDDIKLSNGWSDNSMIREPMAFAILRQYMDAPLSNFAKVWINGEYYGLMNNTENIDKRFALPRFLSSKYTFIKCNPESIGSGLGNGPNLEYLGDNIASYSNKYELESATGWYELIQLTDTLNNHFETFESIADIDRFLWMLAFNNVTVNLDSYTGSFRQNYYLYRNHAAIWSPVVWDLNMCFGGFATPGGITSALTPATMQTMSFTLHKNESGWPLIFKLLNDPGYQKMYFAHMRTILQENFLNGQYKSIASGLHAKIDEEVKNDPNHLSTYEHFVNSLTANTPGLNGAPTSPGIFPLMDGRAAYLRNVLSAAAPVLSSPSVTSDLKIGSVASVSTSVSNATRVFLGFRNDRSEKFSRIEMYDDGQHQDGVAADGIYGNSFTIEEAEVQYYLYAENNNTGAFLPERAEHEFFSLPILTETAEAGDLVLNEFMTSNNSGISNEKGSQKDWIEIHNRTDKTLSMELFSLSDDKTKPTKWTFPKNTMIGPREYQIIWADGENAVYLDPHTNFSLSANSGNVVLSYQGTIDQEHAYNAPGNDRSIGRCPDHVGSFILQSKPTPGETNDCVSASDEISDSEEIHIYPNPVVDKLFIRSKHTFMQTEIMDLQGQLIQSFKAITEMDISPLHPGVYILKSLDKRGRIQMHKFIKI